MSKVISVGQNVTLSCSAVGFPTPNIVWIRDRDIAVVSNSGGIEIVTLSTGTQITHSFLRGTNASLNLTGAYHCLSRTTIEGFPPVVVESNPASITVQGMQSM